MLQDLPLQAFWEKLTELPPEKQWNYLLYLISPHYRHLFLSSKVEYILLLSGKSLAYKYALIALLGQPIPPRVLTYTLPDNTTITWHKNTLIQKATKKTKKILTNKDFNLIASFYSCVQTERHLQEWILLHWDGEVLTVPCYYDTINSTSANIVHLLIRHAPIIQIPHSVKYIEHRTFQDSEVIKIIRNIPNAPPMHLQVIGECCFERSSLTSIEGTCDRVMFNAFGFCKELSVFKLHITSP